MFPMFLLSVEKLLHTRRPKQSFWFFLRRFMIGLALLAILGKNLNKEAILSTRL